MIVSDRTQLTEDVWIDESEVARVLGLSNKYMTCWISKARSQRGFPTGSRIGRRRQWLKSEVLAWRAAQHEMQRSR